MNPLWPIQTNGITQSIATIERGVRHPLLTAPTGTGKSRMVCDVMDYFLGREWYAVLYSNRKMLIEQLERTLKAHGFDFGVRAADYTADDHHWPVQISSLPTERARVLKSQKWTIHGEGHKCLVVVDEAHLNCGPSAQAIFRLHDEAGHVRLGVTATPLGLADSYDELIVAGNVSDGRACGALVPCYHYGPDEPDLRHIGRVEIGDDLSESQQRSAMGKAGTEKAVKLFGRIMEWRDRLNPQGKPSLLFGPGVAESLWLAEQFQASGVNAAHIDGADVWIKGEWYRSDRKARDAVAEGSKSGDIKVVCNRFVLREGIDWPWIEHMILAFVCGDLRTYIQIVGRGLRACLETGKTCLILQDHGGAWHRHGSVNTDREWNLEQTSRIVCGMYQEGMRGAGPAQPARCPQCAKILAGFKCRCGWEAKIGSKRSRPVIQEDGTLMEMTGDVYKPRRICQRADAAKLWERMYHRARSQKWDATFRQAEAMFARENFGCYPSRELPLMPTCAEDWYRKVSDIPQERLTRKP